MFIASHGGSSYLQTVAEVLCVTILVIKLTVRHRCMHVGLNGVEVCLCSALYRGTNTER